MSDGFSTLLIKGIAQLLATASVGTWRSDGTAYQATETAIFLKQIAEQPDSAIAISTYPGTDDPTLSDSVLGIQILTRAAGESSTPVDDLADSIFTQLHGLHDITLTTGIRVNQALRRSWASLGQDTDLRWMRSDNYYFTLWRPSLNRL